MFGFHLRKNRRKTVDSQLLTTMLKAFTMNGTWADPLHGALPHRLNLRLGLWKMILETYFLHGAFWWPNHSPKSCKHFVNILPKSHDLCCFSWQVIDFWFKILLYLAMDWHVDREFVCYIDLKIPLQSSPSNSPPLTLQPFFNFNCCSLCMQSSLSRLHADKPCFATLIKLNCFMVVSSATVIETSARVGDFKLKSLSQIRVIFCNIHLPTKLFFKLYKVHLNIIYI